MYAMLGKVMQRTVLALLGLVVLVSAPGVASASMIGDTITVNRFFPDLVTIYTPPDDLIPGTVTTLVVAGPEAASPQPTLYSTSASAATSSTWTSTALSPAARR